MYVVTPMAIVASGWPRRLLTLQRTKGSTGTDMSSSNKIEANAKEHLGKAHGRWLWSEAAKERWRLRDREATTPLLKLKRVLKKLACYPFANRTGLVVLSEVGRLSRRLLGPSEEYVELFKRLRPALVFNGS